MLSIVLVIIALIVYGSLYPWNFVPVQLPANPLWILLHSWQFELSRRFFADIIVNLVLYMPLGLSAYLALYRSRPAMRIFGPVALGTVLSASIEMVQLYFPGRTCSGFDLVNNILGTGLGLLVGMAFELAVEPRDLDDALQRLTDRPAVLLLFCWCASLLFPFFPVMWLGVYRAKLEALLTGPVFAPMPFLTAVLSWFVAGQMLDAARVRRRFLYASLMLVPCQFFVSGRQPAPAVLMGAIAGTVLYRFAGGPVSRFAAPGFLVLIVLRGLVPFQPGPPHEFLWVPFSGFLNMDWQAGLAVWFEKAFLYGAAAWLLSRAGLKTWKSATLLCAVLLAVEIAQTRLPGRVSEITDPLLGLLLVFGLDSLSRDPSASADLRPRAGSRR